jgi:hypothetical protein
MGLNLGGARRADKREELMLATNALMRHETK